VIALLQDLESVIRLRLQLYEHIPVQLLQRPYRIRECCGISSTHELQLRFVIAQTTVESPSAVQATSLQHLHWAAISQQINGILLTSASIWKVEMVSLAVLNWYLSL
jgi:hypothetical protein